MLYTPPSPKSVTVCDRDCPRPVTVTALVLWVDKFRTEVVQGHRHSNQPSFEPEALASHELSCISAGRTQR